VQYAVKLTDVLLDAGLDSRQQWSRFETISWINRRRGRPHFVDFMAGLDFGEPQRI